MRKLSLLALLVVFIFVAGCAGMSKPYQRNMEKNAALWSVIGAATGAGIAIATHGAVGDVAILGGIAGAYLGAGNTPEIADGDGNGDCSRFKNAGERAACQRGKAERASALQRERERRAYRYGRGRSHLLFVTHN